MTDRVKSVGLKCWLPTGKTERLHTIASTEGHLGNLVAEGCMDKDQYYPSLVADYKRRFEREVERFNGYREQKNSEEYARRWVERYLDILREEDQ